MGPRSDDPPGRCRFAARPNSSVRSMDDNMPTTLVALYWTIVVAAPLHLIACHLLRFLLRADKASTRSLFAESRLIGAPHSSYILLRGRHLLPWSPIHAASFDDLVARRVLSLARVSGVVAAAALASMLPAFFVIAAMGA